MFDSVDFSTELVFDSGKPESVAANHTFYSTPGHAATSYSLVGIRN